jgi:diacylglycerol kinase
MPIASLPVNDAAEGQWMAPAKPRRSWRAKFGDALRGLKLGIRGHSSFFVHFFFAALTLVAAVVLRCSLVEWCLLVGCIGMVLTAELFNSAIETLFHGLDADTKPRVRACLDVGAAAVLIASVCAVLVGGLVFFHSISALVFQTQP